MARAGLLLLGILLLLDGGCLVNSQCHADYDCNAPERCRDGRCMIECNQSSDCWPGGIDNGKQCVRNRCEFRFDERVAALNFCETVANPASGKAGQRLCLQELKGKVVLLYFGWIT